MPIFRIKNKIIYFSHIPKCGGTSIESFFSKLSDGNISFLDVSFDKNHVTPWSTTSPQHITGNDLARLFPIAFFDHFFTITRNPFDRFCSAFTFQKHVAKTISLDIDVNEFISKLTKYQALQKGHYDNHFLPQTMFFYPGAPYRVFKLENGLDNVKNFISTLFDINLNHIPMPHRLKIRTELKTTSANLNENSKKIIMNTYRMDFEKLGY